MVREQRPQWFDEWENPPPFIKAPDEVRRLSTREGWCFFHVQAIQVAIDLYAEAALGNRGFLLNKPRSIGRIGSSGCSANRVKLENMDSRPGPDSDDSAYDEARPSS
jgi:hypothetical protein